MSTRPTSFSYPLCFKQSIRFSASFQFHHFPTGIKKNSNALPSTNKFLLLLFPLLLNLPFISHKSKHIYIIQNPIHLCTTTMAAALPWLFAELLLFISFASSSSTPHSNVSFDPDSSVSRETFTFQGDVAWVVQISDLHISSYHPDRGEDLMRLLPPALRLIRPALLLITGDLTDAKNKRRTATRQDELEWIQYKKIMDVVIRESGMEKRAFFDIRGNHDKYGVPYVGAELDFFSKYSISSQLNRLSTIQSISLMGNNWKYLFLGVDDSLKIGIRGPSNLFGHPTDKRIETVESELEQMGSYPGSLVSKVVFGHFPLSFIASSEKGNRYESVFARKSVAAYLCGHLHAKFSNQLWRLHSIGFRSVSQQIEKLSQFWEWELGDWKESKLIRILSIDRGEVSFVDIKLADESVGDFSTTVLITHPLDSRSMNRLASQSRVSRNDISALVFSAKHVLNVTAKIFDASRSFRLVELLQLHASASSNHGCLFRAKWNISNYKNASGTRFWLQVVVVDAHGRETSTTPRPFSVEGKLAHLPKTWLAHLILHIKWESLYLSLLWSNVSFLMLLLFLPKLLSHFVERNPSYQKWAMSIYNFWPIEQRMSFFGPVWFLIEGSRDRRLWCAMVLYLLYLLKFSWFWGHATSEHDAVSSMSIRGWTIKFPNVLMREEVIGIPDIMTITLPFLYLIVCPLYLLIYSLLAERSVFFLHTSKKMDSEPSKKSPDVSSLKFSNGTKASVCKICRGWIRTALLLCCFVFVCLHIRLCSTLMWAYGARAVALSPPVLWIPPLLLAATVYETQSRGQNCHAKM